MFDPNEGALEKRKRKKLLILSTKIFSYMIFYTVDHIFHGRKGP